MRGHRWAAKLRERELGGSLVFGMGLLAAAALNFLFVSAMGRMLRPPLFATLGVLIAALLAVTAPVNALQGGTEMFAALHDRFPRGRSRLWFPCTGLVVWAITALMPSPDVRAVGWFVLGSSALLLLSWNRGALAGLGRFSFVGVSFLVDGAARLALAVGLVAVGYGLSGAAAGYALGILIALLFTEAAIPRMATVTREPLGRDVVPALVGLLALGVTQVVDVFAIRLANPVAAGPYVGAASLARLALFAQMPAAAYALRRAAVEGPRRALPRTMLLALAPGVLALMLLQVAPHSLLHLAYGGRYLESASTIRILALAMFFGGLTTVTAQLLMGSRSTAWAWTVTPVAMLGTLAIIGLAHAPTSVALFSLFIQAAAFLAVALPAYTAIRARPAPGRRVLFLNWRDTLHPQGGGSEVYVEQVARRLATAGWTVTIFCSKHANAPRREVRDGVRFVRRGGWWSVYPWAFAYHLTGRLGPHDVVVDVRNGIPFLAPIYCRRPVVSLVHHVHREQWGMNFSPGWARFGWWVESRLSPRVYGGSSHVTVSEATRRELAALGIPAEDIDLVHNGAESAPGTPIKAPHPALISVGRLVPHKRVEIVLRAAARLRGEFPDLHVTIVGQGPWAQRLEAMADQLGLADVVTFTGWVDEATKQDLLRSAWVLAMPSVKEGWGLAVMEAAACRTPAVAFRVGGLEESIAHGRSGLLADDAKEFLEALRLALADPSLRDRLGEEAARRAAAYSWEDTAMQFAAVLRQALLPEPVATLEAVPVVDP